MIKNIFGAGLAAALLLGSASAVTARTALHRPEGGAHQGIVARTCRHPEVLAEASRRFRRARPKRRPRELPRPSRAQGRAAR